MQRLLDLEEKVTQLQSNQTVTSSELKSEQVVLDAINEFQEREQKKHNLIIFNVPESKHKTVEERVGDDKKFFKQVCDTALVQGPIDYSAIRRIGIAGKSERPRPVIITFSNSNSRSKILNCSKHLKQLPNSTVTKVVIKPDLTKRQLDSQKLLQESCNQRNEAGEDCVIWRGKVMLRADIKK
jgi:hypothetical protein